MAGQVDGHAEIPVFGFEIFQVGSRGEDAGIADHDIDAAEFGVPRSSTASMTFLSSVKFTTRPIPPIFSISVDDIGIQVESYDLGSLLGERGWAQANPMPAAEPVTKRDFPLVNAER